MANLFLKDSSDDYSDKINLDDLYEKKKIHDQLTINNYKVILSRIHAKIKTTSRLHLTDQHCWFLIPEILIGVPKFNKENCIAYIIDQLQTNGFKVRYTHPNLLFISWTHWVPDYVRSEIKKKTGMIIDGNGKILENKSDNTNNQEISDPNSLLIKTNNKSNLIINNSNNSKNTKDISNYKPSGNLIYNNDLLNSLQKNLHL